MYPQEFTYIINNKQININCLFYGILMGNKDYIGFKQLLLRTVLV